MNILDAQSTSDYGPALAICVCEQVFACATSHSAPIADCCLLAYPQALMGSFLLQVTGTRSASSGSGLANATANWTRACASRSWQMLQFRHAFRKVHRKPVHLCICAMFHLARHLGPSVSSCTVAIAANLTRLSTTALTPQLASCLQLLQRVLEKWLTSSSRGLPMPLRDLQCRSAACCSFWTCAKEKKQTIRSVSV